MTGREATGSLFSFLRRLWLRFRVWLFKRRMRKLERTIGTRLLPVLSTTEKALQEWLDG